MQDNTPLDIRLIAADIDGTLLPRGGAVSERTRRAIAACWARGIPFIIATGRWIAAIHEVQQLVGLVGRPCIISNGGAVLDGDGSILHEWFIPEADARRVCELLLRHPVMVNSYVRNGQYRVNTAAMAGRMNWHMGEDDPRLIVDDEAAFFARGMQNVYQLEAYSEDPALLGALKAQIEAMGMSVSSASERNIEIMSRGHGKGTALRWLAEHWGVPIENTMAFGDYYNDMDMLRAAGWPVAMGNAADALKAVARIIAPADADDGVARVVCARVLEETL